MRFLLRTVGLHGMSLMLIGTIVALADSGSLLTARNLVCFMDQRMAAARRLPAFKVLQAKYYLTAAQLVPVAAGLMLSTKDFLFAFGFILWLGPLSLALPFGQRTQLEGTERNRFGK